MSKLSQFTNLYPLSKTLRFELKPIGQTLENIQKSGILEQDEHRADSYKKVKNLIDQYHKAFIENALKDFKLQFKDEKKENSLEEYYFYYKLRNRDENQKKKFQKVQDNLRKQIAARFKSTEGFDRIDKKELIKEDLKSFLSSEVDQELVAEFNEFTTYFTGFHENRMNMYVSDEKSTAIAYRLIHQNLPKFIDNIDSFAKLEQTEIKQKLSQIANDFEEYLNVKEIGELFTLEYFSTTLTQTQIDVYNAIIGGKSLENGEKIQGINELINLYNQKQSDKKLRLPQMKPLYKQILSDRNAISFLPEEFTSDNELLESIENCYEDLNAHVFNTESGHSLKELLQNLRDYDLNKIYVRNDTSITEISQKLFGDWGNITKAVGHKFEQQNPKKAKDSFENYEEKKNKFLKSFDSFRINYLNECLNEYSNGSNISIEQYFTQLGANNTENNQKDNLFKQIEDAYANVQDLLNSDYPETKDLAQDKEEVAKIKVLLDAIKSLQFFVKPLLGSGKESDKDDQFYAVFSQLWDTLDQITPLYNKVRNRLTRKPYSEEKIKLNFNNSTLLNGWDVNNESANLSVILRKDGLFYLGIMNKKSNKIFEDKNLASNGGCYEKMEYKLLPGANKMLPKVFFSEKNKSLFNPSQKIKDIYQSGAHTKGDTFNLNSCHELIDFFKDSIQKHEDWKKFGFKFSDTKNYEDISGFYREIESQGYKISFRNISVDYINQLVEEGKLFLFQLYNKDFSPYSKGTPNMHTLYWKMLFDDRNLKNIVYKLNGEAEVFYRKSSISPKNTIKHPANNPVANKNPLNPKKESLFKYDLIKDKRYTVDKFLFHVPITMNYNAPDLKDINNKVNDFIKEGGIKHIIGIDRGERHLLYLSVIDLEGNIKEQYTLNEIKIGYNGLSHSTNYHDLLDKKEGDRTKARQDWATIENIKELKQGYLSQVIHKIAQLIIKYNAIVVLEDLNMGFMRGRQKFEKSVYQQFEKMLIDKLNYLVDKKVKEEEEGGLLQAYQLTNKFSSFQKLGKQSGFLFYIPAWNTSKMDPTTGFVNLFDTRYESVEKSKTFFNKFGKISFNKEKNWFEFSVKDYTSFSTKAEGTRQDWTLCSHGTRIKTFRNPEKNSEWDSQEINLTEEFKKLFNEYGVDVTGDLKESINSQNDKKFFEGLLQAFHLMLQMRNSITGSEVDYLISPVMNKDGEFYDSRICKNSLPENADANGAYNIARKGLWSIQQIKACPKGEKIRLAISNKEWLNYVQAFDK